MGRSRCVLVATRGLSVTAKYFPDFREASTVIHGSRGYSSRDSALAKKS